MQPIFPFRKSAIKLDLRNTPVFLNSFALCILSHHTTTAKNKVRNHFLPEFIFPPIDQFTYLQSVAWFTFINSCKITPRRFLQLSSESYLFDFIFSITTNQDHGLFSSAIRTVNFWYFYAFKWLVNYISQIQYLSAFFTYPAF